MNHTQFFKWHYDVNIYKIIIKILWLFLNSYGIKYYWLHSCVHLIFFHHLFNYNKRDLLSFFFSLCLRVVEYILPNKCRLHNLTWIMTNQQKRRIKKMGCGVRCDLFLSSSLFNNDMVKIFITLMFWKCGKI